MYGGKQAGKAGGTHGGVRRVCVLGILLLSCFDPWTKTPGVPASSRAYRIKTGSKDGTKQGRRLGPGEVKKASAAQRSAGSGTP